jgi:hypothetical protein
MSEGQKKVRNSYFKKMEKILKTQTDDLADIQNLKAATIKFLALLQSEEDRVNDLP